MRSRNAVAQYEATIVLVMISISLASVVYAAMRRESGLAPQPVFVDAVTRLGGSPTINRLVINSSSAITVSSLGLDAASSALGVLAFDGSGYSTVKSLCGQGTTTFFSVLATQAGSLRVTTDGVSWVAGAWTSSADVSPGWQEVMIEGGTSCAITLPGGDAVPSVWSPASPVISSVPANGPLTGTTFTFYVPSGGGGHRLLLTSTGGFDDVEI
jgi:hypothetical protein